MLRIGVLVVPPIQLLDISPVDLFAMMTQSYFRACNLPEPLIATAIPDSQLTISYISMAGSGSVGPTTANLGLHIDTGIDDPRVAPGTLDLLVIPGPPPDLKPQDEVLSFVRDHVKAGVQLFTICTGVFVAAHAGVLDGKTAVGPRGLQDSLAKSFPRVNWVDKRYVSDGKIFTSGGITNGMDMVGWYMKQHFPAVADTVLALADVEIRSQEYNTGKVAFNLSFVLLIIKAWIRGLLKGKIA